MTRTRHVPTAGIYPLLAVNAPHLEFILLSTASVGQPRCVKDANLGKRLHLLTTFKITGTYHYAVLAREFVKPGRVGLALAVSTTLLVGVVEGVEVVVIDAVAMKGIGDELQE